MKYALLSLFFVPFFANASGSVFNTFHMSDDSDSNTIFQYMFGYWEDRSSDHELGIAYRYSKFEEDDSYRLGILYDRRFAEYWGVYFDAGVETDKEVTGFARLSRWYDNRTVELTVQQDFIDNVEGTQNGITYLSAYGLVEQYIGDTVLIGVIGATDYSDNAFRKEGRFIVVQPTFINNINVRLETQYYEFDNFSPFYFSPDDYARALIGVQTYHALSETVYGRAKLLFGRQWVNGFGEESYIANYILGYRPRGFPLEVTVEITLDQKEPAYTYEIANLKLEYKW